MRSGRSWANTTHPALAQLRGGTAEQGFFSNTTSFTHSRFYLEQVEPRCGNVGLLCLPCHYDWVHDDWICVCCWWRLYVTSCPSKGEVVAEAGDSSGAYDADGDSRVWPIIPHSEKPAVWACSKNTKGPYSRYLIAFGAGWLLQAALIST